MISCKHEGAEMTGRRSVPVAPEVVVEPLAGLDDVADALLTMRNREELKRFLRDLCTLSELEALAHRWQTARLVEDGVVDVGITGANLVAEAQARVETLAELGFAHCTLEAAVPEDASQEAVEDLAGLRVATAYPVSTRRLLDARGVRVDLVPVSGS